jgi:hypothetical protein
MEDSVEFLSFEEALQTLTLSNLTSNHWVPSLKKYINFKEVTALQQKKLLSNSFDSTVITDKILFDKFLYEILKENLNDKSINIDHLSTIDRIFLGLSLRHQISPEIKLQFSPTNGELYEEVVDLTDYVNQIKNYKHPEFEEIIFKKENLNLKILLGVPSLNLDVYYLNNNPVYKNLKKLSNEETLKAIITDGYISETSKHIAFIELDGKDLNYQSWQLSQKLKFTEQLPAITIQNIFEIITKWKKETDEYLVIRSSLGDKANLEINSLTFLN